MSSTGYGRGFGRGFDPADRQRVPLAGHPVSTGAACPREPHAVRGWAVPAERRADRPDQPALPICLAWLTPDTSWRKAREQAYVPAEQPPPSQGARLPPADAHPCGSRHPRIASSQGTQEPGGLSANHPYPVLPAAQRLTDAPSFRTAVRRGRRAGSSRLVVHLVAPAGDEVVSSSPRVGFVVSKAVGNAVVRNRVRRRLRHLARGHVDRLPASGMLVVRALPASAQASYAELDADLTRCLERVV